jgi:hypothetical protein
MQAFGNPYLRYRPKTCLYILWFPKKDIGIQKSEKTPFGQEVSVI